MHRKIKTWVVVADGARARILEGDGAALSLGPGLSVIEEFTSAEGRTLDRELGTDRPGRTQMASGNRHAVEPPTSPKDVAEQAFIRELAQRLTAASHGHAFERLIIVAPPKALGSLRKALSADVLAKVTVSLDKELTNHSEDDIKNHVESAMR